MMFEHEEKATYSVGSGTDVSVDIFLLVSEVIARGDRVVSIFKDATGTSITIYPVGWGDGNDT